MSGAMTVTVAGAGALGLSTALSLADAGCRVTVFDPAGPFANASGVAAGMLAPAFEAALDEVVREDFDLLVAARDLWPALEARAGVAVDRSGAMAAGSDGWLGRVRAAFDRLGLHAAELPRRTAEDLAPGLSPGLGGALLTREDWRLEPRQALAALRAAAEAAGVVFRPEAAGGFEGAERLVVATGAERALAGLAPELAALRPIKGHILRVAGEPGRVSLRGDGIYAVPAEGGWALGATMEAGVADPAVDPAREGPLRAAGAGLLPEVAQARGVLFAGVRAATADGLPFAGASAAPNVLLATGARRNGWLLAPLVAKVVAACLTGGDPGPYAARLDPARGIP
jgi:glycine oxidase